MSNFAQLNENNIVVNVIRSETPDDSLPLIQLPLGHRWIRTSYHGNIRKRFAGIGYTYDEQLDVFYGPKPYPSWSLDENYDWAPPKPRPEGDFWEWSEEQNDWVDITPAP
jgi:hypothetical protein